MDLGKLYLDLTVALSAFLLLLLKLTAVLEMFQNKDQISFKR